LPGALGGQHDQFKSVIDIIQTVFNSYSRHDSVVSLLLTASERGRAV